MSWENRGKSRYYYRKTRKGPRVTSEYFGNSSTAHLISESATRARQKRLLARTQRQRQESVMKQIDIDLESLANTVRALLQATLLTSGYHPHKGQWRRKHGV